ncbi:sugar efflux MFS family transporter [Moraxella macacae 0408225]|uniref:Sugar efflux MFS family transporter n=1 Tax=Moraxella macacae 0408225 TaxID=1230338 RepID=L2F8J1_9GAMM|nr:MFS transporter [Moraxella macacae]ELA09394.1 sugar efflux MFS family transporter [Moraxella macacae 0408225]
MKNNALQFNAAEKKAVFGLGSIFALRMLGLFMIVPVFAVYGEDYQHATPFLIGLAIGIYGLSQAIFQIPMSVMADKYPRKPMIVAGLLLFALGGVICALASDIYTVILGRFVAGSGAVSAVVMALLADVTTEQNRTKAMATMGLTIAVSVMIAFGLGPMLTKLININGLFWLTSILALLAMSMLLIVPNPKRMLKHNLNSHSFSQQLAQILTMPNVNRLHLAIFSLHLTMTAMFTLLPKQFMHVLNLSVAQQGYVYLPLLLLGFIIAVPLIIIAEKKRKMRQVFLSSLLLLVISLAMLAYFGQTKVGLILGLALYFIGFNSLEATIPSWISKQAPVANKATVMGINSSCQFLGAFVGGALGGVLLTEPVAFAWVVLAGVALVSFGLIMPIVSPPYLTSFTVTLPKQNSQQFSTNLLKIEGIDEVVVMEKEGIAYLKLDKNQMTDKKQQQLTEILGKPLNLNHR